MIVKFYVYVLSKSKTYKAIHFNNEIHKNPFEQTLQNTEGAIKNGQSRETSETLLP